MIEVTYLEPTGFIAKQYETPEEAVSCLKELKEKDIFINHAPIDFNTVSTDILTTADHILIQDKLIGA